MHLFSKDPDAVEEHLTLSLSEVVHETVGKHWQIASEYWRASIIECAYRCSLRCTKNSLPNLLSGFAALLVI